MDLPPAFLQVWPVAAARQNKLPDEALRVWQFYLGIYLGIQTAAIITDLE